jgi:hypothetical protein
MVAFMITLIFLQKRYKLSDDGSYDMNARYVFEYNANDVVADEIYYARIQAIKAWYRANADDRPMPNTKAEWSSIYLTEEQYLEVNRLSHLISHEAMYLLALFKKFHVGVGAMDGHLIRRLSGLVQMVGFCNTPGVT